MKIFFELIRVSIGCQNSLSRVPMVSEWQDVYQMVEKQSLVGICFNGVRQLPREQLANMPTVLKMQWLAFSIQIQQRNEVIDQRCAELQRKLDEAGFESCVLKGQGVAELYGSLAHFRQSGDIDV